MHRLVQTGCLKFLHEMLHIPILRRAAAGGTGDVSPCEFLTQKGHAYTALAWLIISVEGL